MAMARLQAAGAVVLAMVGYGAGPALAATGPEALFGDGHVILDLRARYETVDDANCSACVGRDASAFTLRARLGYETGVWGGFSALFDIDQIWSLGDDRYNSTRNGRIDRPVVSDPEQTRLNRLQISYATPFDTKVTLGRQRLTLGNQRFVGNSGWRQHEQTFDALALVNTSITGLTLTYAYIDRVNRVFGEDDPVPATGQAGYFGSDSHVFHANYAGLAGLKLNAYGILIDLTQPGPSPLVAARLSTATWGVRAEGTFEIAPGATLLLNADYAVQTDYGDNPLDLRLGYWSGEAGLTWKGTTALVGYQSMTGDGTVGFSTPLATLHAFNGWAEIFLTTPANGLNAFHATLAYAAPDVLGLKSLGAALHYYEFETERTSIALGSEIDAQVEIVFDKRFSILLKYADYSGNGVSSAAGGWTPAAADKTVSSAVLSFKY
jgi:hypothetical protein